MQANVEQVNGNPLFLNDKEETCFSLGDLLGISGALSPVCRIKPAGKKRKSCRSLKKMGGVGRPKGSVNKRYQLWLREPFIANLLQEGATVNKIACELNTHFQTVSAYLKRNPHLFPCGYAPKRANTKSKLFDKEIFIRQCLEAGMKKIDLAKELKVSRAGLFKKLKSMGWQTANENKGVQIDTTLFVELFQNGVSYKEMSERFHCHIGTIAAKAKQLGLGRYMKKEGKTVCPMSAGEVK